MDCVLEGTHAGRPVRWSLAVGRHAIGRGPGNAIDLRDREVSHSHAEILVGDEQVVLRDLGSRNGTWVNRRRLSAPVVLKPGDRIQFGGTELEASLQGTRTAETAAATVYMDPSELQAAVRISADEGSERDTARERGTAEPHLARLYRAAAEAGNLLVLPQSFEEMLESVLDSAEKAIPARRILLLLVESDDAPPVVRGGRPRNGHLADGVLLSRALLDAVLRDRESILVHDAPSDARFLGSESIVLQRIRSAMAAPLFDNQRVLGVLYADTDDVSSYGEDHLRAFTLLANLIAVRITNTRLLEDRRIKERMEQELATAAAIQRSLLPDVLPETPGYPMWARLIPCHEAAGDLFEVSRLPDGRVAIAVGDVSGKGIGAALLMAQVMAALRLLGEEGLDLGALVERVHRQFVRAAGSSFAFVTLFVARLDPMTHRLEYVNAGHCPAFLVSPPDEDHVASGSDALPGRLRRLESSGLPVGLPLPSQFTAQSVEIPPGAMLCLYTDGISEWCAGEEMYGEDRLAEQILRAPAAPLEEIGPAVLEDVRGFAGEAPAGDDVTLFLLRRE